MTDYITPEQLRDYIGSTTENFASLAQSACTVASRTIEQMCERAFTADSAATARYYDPIDTWQADTDDFWTTSGLIVATDDVRDGTYSTTWTLDTDYFLEPVNRIVGGITGYPYTRVSTLAARAFYRNPFFYNRRPLIKVTAKWGWAAVPDNITQAALVGAARLFSLKDAPLGTQGLDGWGPVRVKESAEVQALVAPFMRSPVVMA